jgi:hypothetical protein
MTASAMKLINREKNLRFIVITTWFSNSVCPWRQEYNTLGIGYPLE